MELLKENIEYIVIHSSHTRKPRATDGVKLLNKVHRKQGAFSWELNGTACGHHFIVRTDGVVEPGRPLNVPGNHTLGFNEKSVSVCYMGGLSLDGRPQDTRTPKQKASLQIIVDKLREQFPKAVVVTHAQLLPRRDAGCPGFNITNL